MEPSCASFSRVAHASSYQKAAQELQLSHPTVSRAVGRLEEAMACSLLLAVSSRA